VVLRLGIVVPPVNVSDWMEARLILPEVLPLKEYCAFKEKENRSANMKNTNLKVVSL
jgi:hypothetical protein